MPKVKKQKKRNASPIKVEEEVEPGIHALVYTDDDRYGEKYFEELQSKFVHPCFMCHNGLSKYAMKCGECTRTFYFCDKECKSNEKFVIPRKCVYCIRKSNDQMRSLLKWLSQKGGINLAKTEAETGKDLFKENALNTYIEQLTQLSSEENSAGSEHQVTIL